MVLTAALVAQGETIESKVGAGNAILIADAATPTEVTHIDLPQGNWLVRGNINVFELAQIGTVFMTGSIGDTVALDPDATDPVNSEQLGYRDNVILGITLPDRLIQCTGGTTIYLTVFSNQPGQVAPAAYAWGFLSATKTNN